MVMDPSSISPSRLRIVHRYRCIPLCHGKISPVVGGALVDVKCDHRWIIGACDGVSTDNAPPEVVHVDTVRIRTSMVIAILPDATVNHIFVQDGDFRIIRISEWMILWLRLLLL